MSTLDRNVLRELLKQWRDGKVTDGDVWKKADYIEETMPENYPGYYEYYDDAEGHPEYIPLRVVEQLNFMHDDLVTERDAPFLLWFLDTPEGCEKAAMSAWLEYFSPQRWLARRNELAQVPENFRRWAIRDKRPPARLLGDWIAHGRWKPASDDEE